MCVCRCSLIKIFQLNLLQKCAFFLNFGCLREITETNRAVLNGENLV